MTVKCIDVTGTTGLTLGKKYDVEKAAKGFLYIVDDTCLTQASPSPVTGVQWGLVHFYFDGNIPIYVNSRYSTGSSDLFNNTFGNNTGSDKSVNPYKIGNTIISFDKYLENISTAKISCVPLNRHGELEVLDTSFNTSFTISAGKLSPLQ